MLYIRMMFLAILQKNWLDMDVKLRDLYDNDRLTKAYLDRKCMRRQCTNSQAKATKDIRALDDLHSVVIETVAILQIL